MKDGRAVVNGQVVRDLARSLFETGEVVSIHGRNYPAGIKKAHFVLVF